MAGFQPLAEENASRLQEPGVVDSSKEQDFPPKLLVHCTIEMAGQILLSGRKYNAHEEAV